MDRKDRWEVDKVREASILEPSTLDTTTEAIEPGEELEWGTSTFNSTDKGESFPGVNSVPSYPLGYSTTEEHPMMIQQVVDAKGWEIPTGRLETRVKGSSAHTWRVTRQR